MSNDPVVKRLDELKEAYLNYVRQNGAQVFGVEEVLQIAHDLINASNVFQRRCEILQAELEEAYQTELRLREALERVGDYAGSSRHEYAGRVLSMLMKKCTDRQAGSEDQRESRG